MIAVVIIGAILIGIPILVMALVDPGGTVGLLLTLGFLALMVGLCWYAEYRPWVFDTQNGGVYEWTYAGFVILIILIAISVLGGIRIKDKYHPTRGSLKNLEKEVEHMTRLQDRRALIMAMVPSNARDPKTGRLATIEQLTDYRWCALWLAYHNVDRVIKDPAKWPPHH